MVEYLDTISKKHNKIGETTIEKNHKSLITMVMGKSRNQERKLTRNNIHNEILKEIRGKKINDMTNQRFSKDTQPIPVVEDSIVLPTNPHK